MCAVLAKIVEQYADIIWSGNYGLLWCKIGGVGGGVGGALTKFFN